MSDLASLVARRLCHDFAGPIGAIATAVELLGEGDDGEIRSLIGDSARGLAASLRLYRVILSPGEVSLAAHEVEALLSAWVATRDGLVLNWQLDDEHLTAARAATVLGLAMVACDALARGGTLTVATDHIEAEGPHLRLDTEVHAALAGESHAQPTPRAALARLVVEHAARGGHEVEVSHEAPRLRLRHGRRMPT